MRGGLDTELVNNDNNSNTHTHATNTHATATHIHTYTHTRTFEVGPAKPFVTVCEDGCPHEDVRLGKLGGGGRDVLN